MPAAAAKQQQVKKELKNILVGEKERKREREREREFNITSRNCTLLPTEIKVSQIMKII